VSPDVTIVDSGGANLASLQYAFERLRVRTTVTDDGTSIASAERVVLPGVGAAGYAMRRLRQAGLLSVLRTLTQPVLGICLGMQLLLERTDEDDSRCLRILPGVARRLEPATGRAVPHMGWNQLRPVKADPILDGVPEGEYVYFLHSYATPVSDHTLATCAFGTSISAVVRRANFWGTQFHPERSGKVGTQILQNFLRVEPCS
jgi:glutamine amidotransferase